MKQFNNLFSKFTYIIDIINSLGKESDMMEIQMATLGFKRLMGASTPQERIANVFKGKVKTAKAKVIEIQREQKKKYNRKQIK